MRYSISFTSGELAGKAFPLSQDKLLSIGRSNSSDVKLTSKEISPKHLTVRLSKANVAVIEVFSTHVTMHNGKSLSMGDSVEMAANDTVQLGPSDVFTLVSMAGDAPSSDDDEMKTTIKPMAPVPPPANDGDEMKTTFGPKAPVPPPSSDSSKTQGNIKVPPRPPKAPAPASDGQSTQNNIKPPVRNAAANSAPPRPAAAPAAPKTAPPKPAPSAVPAKASGKDAPKSSGSGETVAIQTLLASDEELEKIKSSFQSKQRRKTGIWVVIVAFFLALCISVYIIMRPEREDQLTWPVDSNDEYLNDFQVVVPYLAVCFPKLSGNQLTETANGFELFSAIGKQRDVPLHIVASTVEDKATLTVSREEAFQAWMKQQKEQDSSLDFATLQEFVFTCQNYGSGVPFNRVSYRRRVQDEDYFGYAVFLRFEDRIHTVLIEVPLSAQWRSNVFFRNYLDSMVIFAARRAPEFWEGTSDYKKDSSIEEDFNEVKIYQKRKSPVYWEKIHYSLISALIKAKQKGDESSLENAKSLLAKLRTEQREWYNTQKLAYQLAEKNEKFKTMKSIQSMASSIFTPEFQQSDYRYELIKRKDWK